MSETPPPNTPESGDAPPPPPSSPPPGASPPPPSGPPPAAGGDDTVMLVLAYLWILALIPLLAEKEKPDVQWHAKNGILIMVAEIGFWVVLTVVGFIPVIGSIIAVAGCLLFPLIFIGFLALRVLGIVKATKGEKLRLPVIADFVDQWK